MYCLCVYYWSTSSFRDICPIFQFFKSCFLSMLKHGNKEHKLHLYMWEGKKKRFKKYFCFIWLLTKCMGMYTYICIYIPEYLKSWPQLFVAYTFLTGIGHFRCVNIEANWLSFRAGVKTAILMASMNTEYMVMFNKSYFHNVLGIFFMAY